RPASAPDRVGDPGWGSAPHGSRGAKPMPWRAHWSGCAASWRSSGRGGRVRVRKTPPTVVPPRAKPPRIPLQTNSPYSSSKDTEPPQALPHIVASAVTKRADGTPRDARITLARFRSRPDTARAYAGHVVSGL